MKISWQIWTSCDKIQIRSKAFVTWKTKWWCSSQQYSWGLPLLKLLYLKTINYFIGFLGYPLSYSLWVVNWQTYLAYFLPVSLLMFWKREMITFSQNKFSLLCTGFPQLEQMGESPHQLEGCSSPPT